MGSSTFIQLTPYILLEYSYADSSTTYVSSQVKLARIKNDYLGTYQFLNTAPAETITQNVLNTSAVNIGGVKWASTDRNVPTPYYNIDPKITYTDLSGLFTSLYVAYDKVRLHILSGYNMDDLQGFLTQVYVREAQTSNFSILANNLYLKSQSRDVLNPKPLLIGGQLYDKYVEFLVPSLKSVNADFFSNPTNPVSIGYQYSSDNMGFLFNGNIYVKVFEIPKLQTTNGILYFWTDRTYTINLNQADFYSGLIANIEEAANGDYFNYYPSYDGNFIQDFISQLNAAGGDYVVINEIDIYEQVGVDHILTSSFSQVQTTGFDAPLSFRPILKYADSALTFSVDYNLRVFNKLNAFQITRQASTTSYQPRKYGTSIEKIQLAQQSYPLKVYNKVYGGANISYPSQEVAPQPFNTVYVPVYYETQTVLVDFATTVADGQDPNTPQFSKGSVFFGQGDARIYLSNHDSFFKFTIKQKDSANGGLKLMDLSKANPTISFKDSLGKLVSFAALNSTTQNSLASGDVIFKVTGDLYDKVLGAISASNNANTSTFNIISNPVGTSSTVIYTGSVDRIENIAKEQARMLLLSGTASSPTISATSTVTVSGTGSTGSTLSSLTTASSVQPSILQQLNVANSQSISELNLQQEVHPISIPNFTVDTNALSIKNAFKPVSNTKAKVIANLYKGATG